MSGSGLGLVTTRHAVVATPQHPLRLVGGGVLEHVEVAYETYGELSPARDNVVLVAHALTGDAHAAGHHGDPARRGWWDDLIGPGRAVDTDRFFVVCPNLLGGCRGTTGPSSTDPATGRAYGPDFPDLEMGDLVAVHRRLLEHLGVGTVHAGVGGSLGGMQLLQWLGEEPGRLRRAVLVAATARLTAENRGFSAVAREAITSDPDYRGGRYAEHGVVPARGLKVARMLAHLTYVSAAGLETKYGREGIESYLHHQGDAFVRRFDAGSYLTLTRLLDRFDPFADPAFAKAAAAGEPEVLAISFDSDWRFGTDHSAHIVAELEAAGLVVEHHEIASPWGHDSFLLRPPGYHELVAAFLQR
ncbi:homoserine O-acetyltransferase [Nocardioides zeae]|uniref:Homoserine O-succinyltransferase n=1 Tax=Nocardioides imazamoxiresistens TaxID=3231893 RepID=A0ABU3PSG6_9ACTN|nr:homoserine O-acetyltransferase [Nocardioides zeae]MDT9591831.1 homoserine O-acetyltransferase [Nocardioides zeae]